MSLATYPSIEHEQVNIYALGRVSATESFMNYAKRCVSHNALPICEQCGKRYNGRGKRFCSVQCYNDWRGNQNDSSVSDKIAYVYKALRNQHEGTTERITLTGKAFSIAEDAVTADVISDVIEATGYDIPLLFGELGWLMGKYSELSKYDDRFLEIADAMPNDNGRIVKLLAKIENDGYTVDWDSCKPVGIEKQSWRDWLKWKVFGWLRFLVRKL